VDYREKLRGLSDDDLGFAEEGLQGDMDDTGNPESASYSKTEYQRLRGILLQVHDEMRKRGLLR
jgi:hypothetical protein